MARIPDTELERLKTDVSVQRLVEASGGTVQLAHRPGGGTVASATFPSPPA